ncbi:hypothetical protein G9A89_022964 [Geosiphon pyriformis]|nr:hypothetical protein G9A89_022964 [Geosiphon pyriformis]
MHVLEVVKRSPRENAVTVTVGLLNFITIFASSKSEYNLTIDITYFLIQKSNTIKNAHFKLVDSVPYTAKTAQSIIDATGFSLSISLCCQSFKGIFYKGYYAPEGFGIQKAPVKSLILRQPSLADRKNDCNENGKFSPTARRLALNDRLKEGIFIQPSIPLSLLKAF